MSNGQFLDDNPFAPYNNPMHSDDPFALWNNPMKRDDPFACWNNPLGEGRYKNEVERKYGEKR